MNTGPEQLKDWMHRRRFLQRETAEYIGFDESYISQLLSRTRSPGLDNAVKIERATGIPVEAWASSEMTKAEADMPERPRKPRLAKA